jgi:hypothetical protein
LLKVCRFSGACKFPPYAEVMRWCAAGGGADAAAGNWLGGVSDLCDLRPFRVTTVSEVKKTSQRSSSYRQSPDLDGRHHGPQGAVSRAAVAPVVGGSPGRGSAGNRLWPLAVQRGRRQQRPFFSPLPFPYARPAGRVSPGANGCTRCATRAKGGVDARVARIARTPCNLRGAPVDARWGTGLHHARSRRAGPGFRHLRPSCRLQAQHGVDQEPTLSAR